MVGVTVEVLRQKIFEGELLKLAGLNPWHANRANEGCCFPFSSNCMCFQSVWELYLLLNMYVFVPSVQQLQRATS